MGRFKGVKGVILLAVIICIVVGYYFHLSNRPISDSKEEETKISAIQEVLLRDLDKNYPPSPKEVVKYYSLITQCFYNEELKADELDELAAKAQELYDDELNANKSNEQYIIDLQTDIGQFAKDDMKVSSFATSASTDVEYFEQDGSEWAKLYCAYSIRQRTTMVSSNEQFLLRKDDAGHWKIYGWNIADNSDGDE